MIALTLFAWIVAGLLIGWVVRRAKAQPNLGGKLIAVHVLNSGVRSALHG